MMLDITETPATVEQVACSQCGQYFAPRTGTGGRPQQFCSERCRKAYSRANPQPDIPQPGKIQEPQPDKVEPPEFDWFNDDAVVVHEQMPIALYLNGDGDLVIRQRENMNAYESGDKWVIVTEPNWQRFLDRLCELLGIGRLP